MSLLEDRVSDSHQERIGRGIFYDTADPEIGDNGDGRNDHSTVVSLSMRLAPNAVHCLTLALLATAFSANAQNRVSIHARLLTPLASYSAEGTGFQAKVIGSFDAAAPSPIPPGTILRGVVSQAASIGLGVKRERASLELSVTDCKLPDGAAFNCNVVLEGIDNARESVTRSGRIIGILAASHPHSWLSGLWFHPGTAISGRSASGLTGIGGKLQSAIAPSPLGAAIAVVSRLLVFRLPNAEIELPAGTDLLCHVVSADTPEHAVQSRAPLSLAPDLQLLLQHAPAEVSEPDGSVAADIINLAFIGSEQQLAKAFRAAGWSTADPLTPKTFARSYAAAAAMRAYARAPVSPLHYENRLPDAVYQKSLNTTAKRHHIRLWKLDTPQGTVWLGAATHDIGVAFEWKGMNLTHRIDPNIDVERDKTEYDLREAGCVEAETALDRLDRASNDVSTAVTDGALIVAQLRDCTAPARTTRPLKRPKRAFTTVIARRFVLEGRHYMTRGNAYYWAYRGVRWTFSPKKATTASATGASSADNVKILLNGETGGTHKVSGTRPTS
jgi:hypothetical protein